MATERPVCAAACRGSSDRPLNGLLHHVPGHNRPVELPSNVTADTLTTYQKIAEQAISRGIEKLGVQAMRLDAISKLFQK